MVTGMDGELVGGNWHSGTAEGDGREYRGWILGHFIDPAEGVRSTKDVEIKWGVHPAGDKRVQWTTDDQRTTLVFRVSGKFRIDLTEGSFTLEREGDYLVWGPRIDHAWEAITDAVVVTVRWPSSVSWETKSPGRRAYLSLGLTNVPRPPMVTTSPSSCRTAIAVRIVPRDTPCSCCR
jgi:hypothetical protein